MKLRIFKNSLRFRLNINDINTLKDKGLISHQVFFGPTSDDIFCYSIVCSSSLQLQATYSANGIKIFLSNIEKKEFLADCDKSLKIDINTGRQKPLRIVIEKDFAI